MNTEEKNYSKLFKKINITVINLPGSFWDGCIEVKGKTMYCTDSNAHEEEYIIKEMFMNEDLFLAEYGFDIRAIRGRNIYPALADKIEAMEKIGFDFGMVIATFMICSNKKLDKYKD